MSKKLIIAVIGGGSTYTPELLEGFINLSESKQLPKMEIRLMDIDTYRLKIVSEFCERMVAKKQSQITIKTYTKITDSIQNANFVLTQLRVGGMEARHQDILLGHKYNMIGQETVGIGGFAKAMRTIPVIKEIVDAMQIHCPNAWLINFTNPVSIITEYLSLYYNDLKWIGLCNYPINIHRSIAKELNVPHSEISFDYYGLNHLSWINNIRHNGVDVTQKVLDKTIDMEKMKNLPSESFSKELLQKIQMIPNYYLLYYYNTEEVLKSKINAKKTRAQEVMEVERTLLEEYKNKDLNEKPEYLEKRGGAYYSTAAVNLINSIYNNLGETHIVNIQNKNTLSNLDRRSSIEAKCEIFNSEIIPCKLPDTPHQICELMNSVKAYENATARAAFENSFELAKEALQHNPLIHNESIEQLLIELLEINKKFIEPLK